MTSITTVGLSTSFTAPASCSTSWTYEASTYNGISSGILLQNALDNFMDTECFPPGFQNNGRAFGHQVFSPGACPGGYVTQSPILLSGATTTAICCSQSYTYTTGSGVQGCLSAFSGPTSLAVRAGGFGSSDVTTSTSISGNFTMWGVPITVEFQANQLSLYTTTTSSISSSALSSSTSSQATTSGSQSITSNPSNTSSPSLAPSSGLSTGAKAGITVGAVAVVLILFAIAVSTWRRKRRNAGNNVIHEAGGNPLQYPKQYENKPQYQGTTPELGTGHYGRPSELGTGGEYRMNEMQG